MMNVHLGEKGRMDFLAGPVVKNHLPMKGTQF